MKLQFLLFVMLGTVLTTGVKAQDKFPTIGWTQMTGTKLSTVVPTYAEIQGNTGPSAVFSTWSAGLFDTGSYNRSADRFLHIGGGHFDWFGNEVYQINILSSPVTSLLKDSTHSPDLSLGSDASTINTPTSRHHYNGFIHYFQTDQYLMRGAFLSSGGQGTSSVWALDPNTLTLNGNDATGWTKLTTTGSSPSTNAVPFFAYDMGDETHTPGIYTTDQLVGPSPWFKFQAVNGANLNTWTTLSASVGQTCNNETNIRSSIDPIHRIYYCVGSGHFSKIGLDSPFAFGNVVGTGCAVLKAANGPGFVWYGPERVFIGYTGGNTVYTYDPVADACTSSTFTGGPTTVQSANGTFGNFQYDAIDGVFISCNSTSEDCFALRLHSNAQLQNDDFAFRKNQAGIIATAGFDSASEFTVTVGNVTGMKISTSNGSHMTQDTVNFTSGGSSALCAVPAQTGADACGSYWQVLPSQLLPPTTFYVQFRQLIDANTLAQNPKAGDGSQTYFKQIIIASTIDGTCAQKEITTVNLNNKGYPTFYTACGAGAGSQIQLSGAFSGDFLNEVGDNCLSTYGNSTCAAAQDTGFNCHFQAGSNNNKSCATYPAGVWVTYYYKIQLGAFGTATTNIQAWRALPGQPYQQWANTKNYTINQDPSSSAGFNLIDFLNYYTNRNGGVAFGQPGFTNYDELLVSSTPIPLPSAPTTASIVTFPTVSLSTASVNFFNQFISTTSSLHQTLILTNTGSASLSITSIVPTGDFGESDNCGSSLGIGLSCNISITFTPTALGTRSGTVTITDNASGSPHVITLAGTGVKQISGVGTIKGTGIIKIAP